MVIFEIQYCVSKVLCLSRSARPAFPLTWTIASVISNAEGVIREGGTNTGLCRWHDDMSQGQFPHPIQKLATAGTCLVKIIVVKDSFNNAKRSTQQSVRASLGDLLVT
jgi:hypothetical protein